MSFPQPERAEERAGAEEPIGAEERTVAEEPEAQDKTDALGEPAAAGEPESPEEGKPTGPEVTSGSGFIQCRVLMVTSPFMRGDDVLAVQRALAAKGFDPGPIDGIYGPKTAQAVGVFQTREKLPVTRVVTPEVYQRLG